MNERFAADPACFATAAELKSLLEKFGIHSGRYLTAYPNDWEARLLASLSTARPVELERIRCVLRRTKERLGLLKSPSLIWFDHASWVENAAKLTSPPSQKLDGLVIPNSTSRPPLKSWKLDDLDLPPTAEERIASRPEEYYRVSELLLLASHELIFVDPYLNPCNRSVEPVLGALLATAMRGNSKCKLVRLYGRARDVLSATTSLEHIRESLKDVLSQAPREKRFEIQFFLLDDLRSRTRMHDRYLCSVKGGVQFSQGFQELRRHAKVTASPVSPAVHKEIWQTYFEGQYDMMVDHKICMTT